MSGFTLDELKLAFGYDLAQRVAGSDGAVAPEESLAIERAFSPGILAASGFLNPTGTLTPRYHDALEEAAVAVPALPLSDRLDLAERIWRSAFADGVLTAAEAQALTDVARTLGLAPGDLAERLRLAAPGGT